MNCYAALRLPWLNKNRLQRSDHVMQNNCQCMNHCRCSLRCRCPAQRNNDFDTVQCSAMETTNFVFDQELLSHLCSLLCRFLLIVCGAQKSLNPAQHSDYFLPVLPLHHISRCNQRFFSDPAGDRIGLCKGLAQLAVQRAALVQTIVAVPARVSCLLRRPQH